MPSARLGLVVGKKAIARAHARNRVKRIIRDRFRRARFELGGVDVVVRVLGRISAEELHQRLDSLFSELEKKTREAETDS
jgi:ribonuclease P protein component